MHGGRVRDVPVVGSVRDLARHARSLEVELTIIAVPSADAETMRSLVAECEDAGVPYRTLPRLQDIVSGHASVSELRRVRIDDLLGRSPVTLDWEAIRGGLAGRRILVTGGGGSIGGELCRQLAGLAPSQLIVMDHSEIHLYAIDQELNKRYSDVSRTVVLGDVGDAVAVHHVMTRYRPEVVFHAAAYKQVPLLEASAREAVRNNVLATATLADAAVEHGIETFVLISTDKAVNSVSLMGASKYLAERVCEGAGQRGDTRFISVRFGNVLDSAGSVVPLFRQQIAEGGPVTVTHEEMTRFFMTIPEACQLIMQAAVMGSGGEVYVLDMGEPVSIQFLAEQMIRLAGKRPGEDIEITFTGLRPGEKLHEQLFHAHEKPIATGHAKIHLIRQTPVDAGRLTRHLAALQRGVDEYDEAALREALRAPLPKIPADASEPRSNQDGSPPMNAIRKVVFPVAGLGTRFLPATKNTPKEMLPVVDKPLIQYAVEEAIDAGADTLVFVTSDKKHSLADHFIANADLERHLEEAGKVQELRAVRAAARTDVALAFVPQHRPLGLGHAVYCAKDIVGDEPFAVILADDMIKCRDGGCLRQMVDAFQRTGASILGVEEIEPKDTRRYGIVGCVRAGERLEKVNRIVEKPSPDEAPSNLAVVGRYILTPRVMSLLESVQPGAGGEIQLTDAISQLLQEESVYGYRFAGRRYDCGSKLGFVKATLEYALDHPDLRADTQAYLRELMAEALDYSRLR